MRRTTLAALAIAATSTVLAACASAAHHTATPPVVSPPASASSFDGWFDGGGYKLALQLGTDIRTYLDSSNTPDEAEVCRAMSEHTTKAIAYGPIPDADKQLHWKRMLDYLDEGSSECMQGAEQGDAHQSLQAAINVGAAQREARLLGSVLNGHSESP